MVIDISYVDGYFHAKCKNTSECSSKGLTLRHALVNLADVLEDVGMRALIDEFKKPQEEPKTENKKLVDKSNLDTMNIYQKSRLERQWARAVWFDENAGLRYWREHEDR